MNINRLINVLIRHEGLRLRPYCDKTGKTFKSPDSCGKLTIGAGRNLEDRGITKEEAIFMLINDIKRFEKEARDIFSDFDELDDVRHEVIINMLFNLGKSRFLKFKKFIKAVKERDFKKAAEEMLNSKWAIQVKNRAKELAFAMEKCKYPFDIKDNPDKVLEYLNKMFNEINKGW